MRKILISRGYGAGWSTWNSGEVAKYMLTYQPIINFLESGGKFKDDNRDHPLLVQLKEECLEKFGEDYVCVLGADDLDVETVSGRVKVSEYDGSEDYEEENAYDGWM
jgi:hypothetical protein